MPGTGGGRVRSCLKNRCHAVSIGTSTTTRQRCGFAAHPVRTALPRRMPAHARRCTEAGDSSEGERRRRPKVTGSNPVRPPLDSSEGEHRSSTPSVAGSTPAPNTMTCHVMTPEREFHTRTRPARRAVLRCAPACRHVGRRSRSVAGPASSRRADRFATHATALHRGACVRTASPRRQRARSAAALPGPCPPSSRGSSRTASRVAARCVRTAAAGTDPPRRDDVPDRTTSAKPWRECREHPQHVLDQAGRDR